MTGDGFAVLGKWWSHDYFLRSGQMIKHFVKRAHTSNVDRSESADNNPRNRNRAQLAVFMDIPRNAQIFGGERETSL